ncbi:MFS transporter [Glutamicibacter sp. X7]
MNRHTWSMERLSVSLIFMSAGIAFASWAGRLSIIHSVFDFSGTDLGAFLACMTVGTMVGISFTPRLLGRFGPRPLLLLLPLGLASLLVMLGISLIDSRSAPWAFLIIGLNGVLFGMLDIVMNICGGQVERQAGRSLMPSFHGFFSLGSVIGAASAGLTMHFRIWSIWHFTIVAIVLTVIALYASSGFPRQAPSASLRPATPTSTGQTNTKSQIGTTILILGLMVAGLSFAEGAANDWLAVASVEGHGFTHSKGALVFAAFTAAMTIGRFAGGHVVDRLGAKRTLLIMGAIGLLGIVLFVRGESVITIAAGATLWGLGSSLGFPVGMSIATAKAPTHGPKIVTSVSMFGYGAMLSGPPLIGFVSDYTGLPQALWLAAAVMCLSVLLTPLAARNHR